MAETKGCARGPAVQRLPERVCLHGPIGMFVASRIRTPGRLCGVFVFGIALGCRESDDSGARASTGQVPSSTASGQERREPAPAPVESVTQTPPTASASGAAPCPADMVLVEGRLCSKPRHDCLRWLDDETLPFARCGEYRRPVECAGERKPMRFCIDRTELTLTSSDKPASDLSFVRALALCKERGRRLCRESEWTFACEGDDMLPYPYGYERRPVCNQDRGDLAGKDGLRDHRAETAAFPECVSPFGVLNMVGNVDELVERDRPYDPRFRNALKGGWWMAGRNRCRPATTAHDDFFHQLQIGTRCCADAQAAQSAPPP